MPKMSKNSVKAFYTGRIDEFWLKEQIDNREVPEWEIGVKMRNFGLNEFEIELLLSRYVENKSMLDIVAEQGWQSLNSASHYLKSALKKLRDGGFSIR